MSAGFDWRRKGRAWLERPRPSRLTQVLGAAVGWAASQRVCVPRGSAGPGTVLVVGGTTVGGAGRTAVVQWLAEQALDAGQTVAVVGHGYRAARRGWVPPGGDPRFGDDAALLAAALPAARIETGPRAVTAARLARRYDLVLTDGGLLDPGVAADVVLAVCDSTASPRVAPAGPTRVALHRLPESVVRWAHRVDEPGAAVPAGAQVASQVLPTGLRGPDGRPVPLAWLQGRSVRVACAIGRPRSFLHTLGQLGAACVDPLVAADHHRFDVTERPPDAGLPWVVTTKDAAHWPRGWPVYVLETSLAVRGEVRGVPPWV